MSKMLCDTKALGIWSTLAFSFQFVVESGSTSTPKLTGIWYEPWYADVANYTWIVGHGTGSDAQLLADANGDGRADAIAFTRVGATWSVALSTGDGFAAPTVWAPGLGGACGAASADANGDSKADAIGFSLSPSGYWSVLVGLSSGSFFWAGTEWAAGTWGKSPSMFVGDVNGDGKADLALFEASTGDWCIALSTGKAFEQPCTVWVEGHGYGSTRQLLADANGDSCVDVAVYFESLGWWWVALSNCQDAFETPSEWASGFGTGTDNQLLADANGDGRADAIIYVGGHQSVWTVAPGNGTAFVTAQQYTWKYQHGHTCWHGKCGLGGTFSSVQLAADVYGTKGAVAPVAVWPLVDGAWRVLPGDAFQSPDQMNTWQAWDIRYRPVVNGSFGTYDSGDPAVIEAHLAAFRAGSIDFMLLDNTNGWDVDGDFIRDRMYSIAGTIARVRQQWSWNFTYTVVVGEIQYTGQPSSLELEAQLFWQQFVTNASVGGLDAVFQQDGLPLLLCYASQANRQAWDAWPASNKVYSSKFNLQWVQGAVPDPTGYPPPALYGEYWGWGYPTGSLPSDQVMVVMPGWNNCNGTHCPGDWGYFVSRANGTFYAQSCWDRVLNQKPQPRIVVINSWNEYAEETAIEPADTSNLPPDSEPWTNPQGQLDPTMYWTATVDFNRLYKSTP